MLGDMGASSAWSTEILRRFDIDPESTATNENRQGSLSSQVRCATEAAGFQGLNHTPGPPSYCNVCNCHYCDFCWKLQAPHMLNKLGPTGIPHEKTDPEVAAIVLDALDSKTSDNQQLELHTEDINTTWFGMIEENGEPTFRDYGRYSDLMASFPKLREERCYPALVSFVGPAGAGKSTLIKLLIELGYRGERCETPVVGRANDLLSPTSGDVHLYPDPKSFKTNRPLLYADCEGIQGGDRLPKAAQAKLAKTTTQALPKQNSSQMKNSVVQGFRHVADRSIKWAKSDEKKRREYAVTNLYPRLLYTFADVVVFVLKSQQQIEKIIVQLLDWAKTVAETSSNQPTLPHAIIALNASPNQTEVSRWDVAASTAWLMKEVEPALKVNVDLQRYVRTWEKKGLHVRSVEMLLARYYSTFKVVQIPENGRPDLINQQVMKLYGEVSRACEESHENKRAQRMLLSSTDLQPYLQYAFDWFSTVLDKPFDFIQASFTNNPIPLDFPGNITMLALKLMHANQWNNGTKSMVKPLFEGLSYIIGSCIMLDSTRHKYNGLASDIFPKYEESIEVALENFCDRGWPCEWLHPRKHARCVNMKNGHAKGHQLANGKVYSGKYQSTFSSEIYTEIFRADVFHAFETALKDVQQEHQKSQNVMAEDQVAAAVHKRATLGPFYKKLRGSQDVIFSNSMCLVCLMHTPEHRLPCGHIICTPCLRSYGDAKSEILVEVDSCPLPHTRVFWNKPWPVAVKPVAAGVRVLCLDGGGVRGIVELEILKLIQSKLPEIIPLRSFFDLIVGTSTGGLIALGLVAKRWSVETCTEKFDGLCEEAFQRRTVGHWGSVGTLWDAYHHSKYKTKPLEKALKKAYNSEVWSNDYIFGGTNTAASLPTKVAVVATTVSGEPAVISNYNRASKENVIYKFIRQDNHRDELEIWEAARATSAAPNYFRNFHHPNTNQVYEDGGIYHNNPVNIANSERKMIWPELACSPPDIMLSIGTGHNPNRKTAPAALPRSSKRGLVTQFQNLKRIAENHIAVSLDSERTWVSWLQAVSRPPDYKSRFIRLNVGCMGDPPDLDDIASMPKLRQYVQEQFAVNRVIEDIAHHLVASSFYLGKTFSALGYGDIRCRLAPGEIQGLGHWLSRFVIRTHRPYFVIRKTPASNLGRKILLTEEILQGMTKGSDFSLPLDTDFEPLEPQAKVEILLCIEEPRDHPKEYMISGFPRTLDDPASSAPSRSSKSEDTSRSSSPRGQRYSSKTPLSELGNLRRLPSVEDWNPLRSSEVTTPTFQDDVRGNQWSSETWSEHLAHQSEAVFEMGDTSVRSPGSEAELCG